MPVKFDDIPGWQFEVKEMSPGVYEVTGKDTSGRNIQVKGENVDKLLDECKTYAKQYIIS